MFTESTLNTRDGGERLPGVPGLWYMPRFGSWECQSLVRETQLRSFRPNRALPNFARSFSVPAQELSITKRLFSSYGRLYC